MKILVGRLAQMLATPAVLIVAGSRSCGRVALTFDDGPDEMTPEYLDCLDQLAVRATFFLVGQNCAARPDLVQEIGRRGHEIAPHGYTHKRFPRLGAAALADELARTDRVIPPQRRRRPFLRPPGGETTPLSLARCAWVGYSTVLWSIDSDDWRVRDVDTIVERATPEALRSGDIVLLHEGQRWTLEAVPRIVERLRLRGLEPATVGEVIDGRRT